MKKITLKRVGQAIAAAVVILGIYAGYLFLMTGQSINGLRLLITTSEEEAVLWLVNI